MIVISNPTAIINEIKIIHSLFENGLKLFHVRKPDYSEEEMKIFLSEINQEFRSQLALHSHHQLAIDFGINRIHNPVRVFNPVRVLNSDWVENPDRVKAKFSKSTHSIEEFNGLSEVFEYAFLSPVFPSISKENYQSEINLFEALKNRTHFKTKLIALGGISSDKIKTTLEKGFDDVAILGTIWNSKNPIENYKLCQELVHSY